MVSRAAAPRKVKKGDYAICLDLDVPELAQGRQCRAGEHKQGERLQVRHAAGQPSSESPGEERILQAENLQ